MKNLKKSRRGRYACRPRHTVAATAVRRCHFDR